MKKDTTLLSNANEFLLQKMMMNRLSEWERLSPSLRKKYWPKLRPYLKTILITAMRKRRDYLLGMKRINDN